MFVLWCLSFDGCCLTFDVCGLLFVFVVWHVWFDVCCVSCVDWLSLLGARCALRVARCLTFVA